ncbi:MAG: hypothetical protein AAF587_27040 [Bacteroidota bacterium]
MAAKIMAYLKDNFLVLILLAMVGFLLMRGNGGSEDFVSQIEAKIDSINQKNVEIRDEIGRIQLQKSEMDSVLEEEMGRFQGNINQLSYRLGNLNRQSRDLQRLIDKQVEEFSQAPGPKALPRVQDIDQVNP